MSDCGKKAREAYEHGGSFGVREEGLIESALDRPRNKWGYEKDVDLADLAAAYGYGFITNHGLVDGNKRVAFMWGKRKNKAGAKEQVWHPSLNLHLAGLAP